MIESDADESPAVQDELSPTAKRLWSLALIPAIMFIVGLIFDRLLSVVACILGFWWVLLWGGIVLFRMLDKQRATSRLLRAITAVSLPLLGVTCAIGVIARGRRNDFLFLVELFWALFFMVACVLPFFIGYIRTFSLLFLCGGGLYAVASVFWFDRQEGILMGINIFWSVTMIIIAYVIDCERLPGTSTVCIATAPHLNKQP